jgi:hypothetical protein
MSNAFPMGAKVRFTQDRLSVLTPRDRKGLAGRIGVVQTDGTQFKKPTVHFPAEGALPELRLFRMDPGHLELVELPPAPESTPAPGSGTRETAPEDSGNLSQSDLDKLFD